MLLLRIDPAAPTRDALLPAVNALRSDGLVAFPTETFYGLAVDPRSAIAVKKLVGLKRRPGNRALPLIARDLDQVAQIGSMTPLAERLAARWWPGPLTVVIPAAAVLCPEVHLSTGKVAVRVPGSALARALAGATDCAVTSTSANRSGEPPAVTADAVAAAFGEVLDVLIDGGTTPGGLPSTIVDATGSEPVLLRAGAIAWERVLEFLH